MTTKTYLTGDFAWHSASNGYKLRLTLTEEAVDPQANASRVGYLLELLSGGNNRFTQTALYPALHLGGTAVAGSSAQVSLDYSACVTLLSGSATVPHGGDGTLDMSVLATLSPAENRYAPPRMELSGTFPLTPIARGSVPALPERALLGAPLTIRLKSASASYTHTLSYTFGSASGVIAEGVGDMCVFTPPLALAAEIPNALSGACTLVCQTYDGGKRIGTQSASVTLCVPPEVVPSVDVFTAARVDNAVPPSWGVYVQGYSQAALHAEATGAYGSHVVHYSVTGGLTGADVTTPVLTSAGENAFTVTVTDSRGRTASKSLTLTVLPYRAPSLSHVTLCRCTSSGAQSSSGTALYAAAQVDFAAVGGRNACSLTLALQSADGAVLSSAALADGSGSVCFAGAVSVARSYRAVLRCADCLGNSASFPAVIPTDTAALHLREGGTGAAFGKYAESDDCLDVAYHTLKLGGVTVDYVVEQGNSGIWTYRKWASGIAECWGKRTVSVTYQPQANWGALFSTGDNSVTRVAYPFAFTSAPMCVAQAELSLGNCMLCTAAPVGDASHTPAYQVVRPAAAVANTAVIVHYFVKGYWKEGNS